MTIYPEWTEILKITCTFSNAPGNTVTPEQSTTKFRKKPPLHVKAKFCSAFYRTISKSLSHFFVLFIFSDSAFTRQGDSKKKTFAMSSIYFEAHHVQKLRNLEVTEVSKFCNTAVWLSIEEDCWVITQLTAHIDRLPSKAAVLCLKVENYFSCDLEALRTFCLWHTSSWKLACNLGSVIISPPQNQYPVICQDVYAKPTWPLGVKDEYQISALFRISFSSSSANVRSEDALKLLYFCRLNYLISVHLWNDNDD